MILKLLSRALLACFKIPLFVYELFYGESWKRYRIKQGRHRSRLRFKPVHLDGAMFFTARFTSSCLYTSGTVENQSDINKLWGFSEYMFSDHVDSARIGWRPTKDGAISLHAYVYKGGMLIREPVTYDPPFIKNIPLEQDIVCAIFISPGYYHFIVGGTSVKVERTAQKTEAMAVQLYPYFGGDETAPHDIDIHLKS